MNETVVPASVVSGFILLLLSSKRIRSRMSALIAWLVGSITGSRGEEESPLERKQIAETSKGKPKGEGKPNKSKTKHRTKKVSEEPTFSTKLAIPIEDVIEETLSEEKTETQSSSSQTTSDVAGIEKPVAKPKKKKKPIKKEKLQDNSDEDIGFSFFKSKPAHPDQKKGKESLEAKVNESNFVHEDLGFSFFPVKEKSRKGKGKSPSEKQSSEEPVITQGITKRLHPSRPPIIDHFKNQNLPIKKRDNTPQITDNSQSFVFVNKVETNITKTDLKESKKVKSHISYASVLTNNIPEIIQLEEEKYQENLSKEVSSSIEVLSQCSEDPDINTELAEEVSETTILASNKEESSKVENITYVKQFNLEQSSKGEFAFEGSIEIIEVEERERNKDFNSHLNKNILSSVIKPVDDSVIENIQDREINHINQEHFKAVQENFGLSRADLIETVGNSTNEFNDQALNDIIEQLNYSKDSSSELNIVKDINAHEDIKNIEALLIKESRDYLAEDFSSEETDFNFTELPDKNQFNSEETQESEAKEIIVTDDNTNLNSFITEVIEADIPTSYFEVLEAFVNKEDLTAGEQECKLSSSEDKLISEVVEFFTPEQIQHELNSKLNLQQEIVGVEQILSQEESGRKPVVEEPFIKKFAYQTTENQSIDDTNLLDNSVQEPQENQILPEQINTHNQKSIHPLVDSTQTVEDSNDLIAPRENNQVYTSKPEKNLQSSQSHNSQDHQSLFATMTQIRVLTLNDKEHQESTIFRIEKNFTLQFRLGPSLLGRKIKLYSNYPKETNGVLKEFDRGTYQLLNWCQDEGCKNADDTALFTQIVVEISGSFHFYFIYENADTEERQGSGYFLVDPILKYGNNEELPLDCIQCQTVLTKQLGPFSTWENKLKVAKESGYNVVHFTPIQELGASKSAYSLSEQLKLNPMFNEQNGKKPTFEDVEKLTTKMRKEWKMLSICDIVLNHTANESEWIKEHSEATYNCVNSPYMRPAYLLDAAFHQFSLDVKKGYYEDRGIPAEVSTDEHLNAIRYHFKTSVLEPLKLTELFIVDVNKYLENFLTLARKTPPVGENEREELGELAIIQDPEFRRLESTINLDLALKMFNIYRLDCFDEESRVKRCAENLKNKLDSLNEEIIKEVTDDLNVAVDNVIAGVKYFRVQADGPKLKDITLNHPLVGRYFTDYGSPKSIKECEEIMYSQNGRYLMAHNGWVMNSDPLKNFASSGTKIYLRRELIAWGDSVKLRYGDKPEDSPFLWDYMRKYVEQTAKIFDGVRLDNCHSTPIPVAEYLLDAARKIRPDLYVVAELFTNSDLTDNIFVNRLGITSLIREAMSAWDSHEEGRLVYRYGGVPVGSFFQPNVRPLVPMVAHALFLDLTHDNPSPVEKRSVFDMLPSTALVNMACCASGSSRGYDELVPHHIHVVDEMRQYTEWSEDDALAVGNVKFVNDKCGIIAAKKALNELHFMLGKEGYNQVYVDQMDHDIVAVTRHNPETHTSYVLVAFTAFGHPDIHAGDYQRGIKPLRVEGVLDEIVLEASLRHIDAKSGGSRFTKFEPFTKDSTWINGLSDYQVVVKQHLQVSQSDIFEEVNSGAENMFQLNFKNFKPGSIAVVRISLPKDMKEAVSKVRGLIGSFSAKKDTDLKQIISRMTLADLNRALYRCDQEERDEGNGFDAYNIPNFGPIVYCGLQGFMSLLANIRPNNNLGHPFCGNLRDGNWLIEYVWKRLKVDEGTKELGQWIEENTKYLHSIPRYLIPSYFDVIVTGIYINLLDQSYSLMSEFVKCGSTFVRGLSLGSLQFVAYIGSAGLPELSPNLAPPKPPTRKNKNGETVQACVTLSAGLPHFSVGYMRNWGRDTFIALRGLVILTGRFEEARQHILGYGACLRHGLIPNLLDGGRNSRFNCRDAIWWWLYCIKSYCEEAPNGTAILLDKVTRIFPTDDSAPQPPGTVEQPLHDVIQEALKVHFQGLKFRERNAGRQIDEQMTDAGFNNQIGIHPETGFVFGGNQWNSGTWMDKMGSSDKAGNKGKPATPRDGSAVELVGLSKAAVAWLWKLNQEGKYPYDGVERTHKNGAVTKWTFKDWSDKIQDNFEKKFWIGSKPSGDESRPDLVNKKNIYKDSFGASQPWTDFQLRPNFPIAMVAAPEMFDPQHAWAALEEAEKYLLGPLGMRTLDPEDWNYRGDYDNSNDSNDFNTAHGFNYHQGPEWVWPVGFFLRAKLIFAAQNGMLKETLASTKVTLSKHFTELQTSAWRGLPELTNSNGSYCGDSSRTQAWSMSCILEVLHDLQQIESKQIIVN